MALFWVEASSLPLVSIVSRFDDDGQEDLSGCGVYVDPEYNILWSYSPKDNKMSCFNPIAANIEGIVNPLEGIVNLNLTHLTLMASIQVGSRGYASLVSSIETD